MKRVTFFWMALVAFGALLAANPSHNDDIISNFKRLSSQQLLDTGQYYYKQKGSADTALVCYSLLINTFVKDSDVEQQIRVIEAYNRSGIIYTQMCDYRTAYECFIKALTLCERANYLPSMPRIYTNIGNIYYYFEKYDMAKVYYVKAWNLYSDSTSMGILNNLGSMEIEKGNRDSAFYFLDKALQISKWYHDSRLCCIQGNIARLYQQSKEYDSAYHYFRLSLDEARAVDRIEIEVEILLLLGKLFFEDNKTDSALFYIELSNIVAKEHDFLRNLSENYLTLSRIEEARGDTITAFEHFKNYARLKDSVFNAKNFGDINQLQRLYEVSKTNQQIEQLYVEQQIKERTIYYQTLIQIFSLIVLLLVSGVLLSVFLQKRKLNTAYKALFEKNLEIIHLQEKSSEKYKQSALTHDMQNELLDRILTLMEDASVICDAKFSVDKLADLVQSNQAYVSRVINNALKKNFRSFLNNYRIREAQRLFSEPDAAKYTIEAVALQVGFNSRTAFHDVFKEITGVSPGFYLKSMQRRFCPNS